jgi:hypothetical protein
MTTTTRRTLSLNWQTLPACETPRPGASAARWTGDGGHRWGPNRGRMCYAVHDCEDCDVTITVDSSD